MSNSSEKYRTDGRTDRQTLYICYTCQLSLSVLGKYFAQNSDAFELYKFTACKKPVRLREVQGSGKVISHMEAFVPAELILQAQVSFMFRTAEPSGLDTILQDLYLKDQFSWDKTFESYRINPQTNYHLPNTIIHVDYFI